MASVGAVETEERFAMRFLLLNAGPDGVHHPGQTHEIGASRAAALADDEVAHYAAKEKQDEHDEERKRAALINDRRRAAGLYPMPLRMALKPGAETADYRPGGPPGSGPLALLDWRELQRVVDILKAQEEHGAPIIPAGHRAPPAAPHVEPHGGKPGPDDPVQFGETGHAKPGHTDLGAAAPGTAKPGHADPVEPKGKGK